MISFSQLAKAFVPQLLFVCFGSAVLADAVPDWVAEAPIPAPPINPHDFRFGGVDYIMFDRQTRLEDKGYHTVSRSVVKVHSQAGLEEVGSIDIDFDPASEELIIHDVWRTRDGERSQAFTSEFIDIRRESEIDYGILDGHLTRYGNILDMQVGDTIDVTWSIKTRPTVFPDHYLYWLAQKPSSYFQADHFRLLVPANRNIVTTAPDYLSAETDGDYVVYSRSFLDTATYDFEDSGLDWSDFYQEVQLATVSEWADVVAPLLDDYAPQPLPEDLAAKVDSFTGSEIERVTAAFRLVQENIRYIGIEIGAGGYLPRSPSTVWSRRFGDCKDKALLLVSMLHHMGIAADPALVSFDDGMRLQDYVPSPYVFNHAIVRVLGEGGTYFLDPTDEQQGGLGPAIVTHPFHWALPIHSGSDHLVSVPVRRPSEPTYDVVTSFTFSDDLIPTATLDVTTTYRGVDADYQRSYLSHDGTRGLVDDLLEWYMDEYPGATRKGDVVFEDDLDANVMVRRESYELPKKGLESQLKHFWMNPYATKDPFEALPRDELRSPFFLEPRYYRHRVELLGLDHLNTPSDRTLENPFFRFTRRGEDVANGIAANFEVEVLAETVLPEDATTYSAAVEEQDNVDDYRVDLRTVSERASASLAEGADEGLPAWVMWLVLTGVGLFILRDYLIGRRKGAARTGGV